MYGFRVPITPQACPFVRSRNIIGRKPTSFEAMSQHRSFVPRKAAMKLPLRANDVACGTPMMLCLRHK